MGGLALFANSTGRSHGTNSARSGDRRLARKVLAKKFCRAWRNGTRDFTGKSHRLNFPVSLLTSRFSHQILLLRRRAMSDLWLFYLS
jgi:hypothetical protein